MKILKELIFNNSFYAKLIDDKRKNKKNIESLDMDLKSTILFCFFFISKILNTRPFRVSYRNPWFKYNSKVLDVACYITTKNVSPPPGLIIYVFIKVPRARPNQT